MFGVKLMGNKGENATYLKDQRIVFPILRAPARNYCLVSSPFISFYVTTDTIEKYIKILNRNPLNVE